MVDAYAAQHHGDHSPAAVQSVGVHLLALHAVLRRRVEPPQVLWVRRRALRTRGVFHPLEPPPLGEALTIRHLFPGDGASEPCTREAYVVSVFEAWERLHAQTIEAWFEQFVVKD